jgi:NAD-dependent SIR2 family protein deacetylase
MPFRKNVFIVGAGFSAESGAPVIRNFFDVAMELGQNPDTSLGPDERKVFKRVFDYRQEMVAAEARVDLDLDNMEELFSLVEMESQLGVSGAELMKTDLVYVILRTLEISRTDKQQAREIEYLYRPEGGGQRADKAKGSIYDFFVNVIARKWWPRPADGIARDTIISLNYDLLLEKAMYENGIAPSYGLPADRVIKATPAEAPITAIRLLKLHGSANWTVCSKHRDKIFVLPPADSTVANGGNAPRCHECGEQATTRLIVPPTWNKDEYRPHLQSVWQTAAYELESAERIFIIGYSMPEIDRFFRYLLAAAIHKNRVLHQVIVVNNNHSHAERIAKLFRRLFEKHRAQSQSNTVGDWIVSHTFQNQVCQAFPTQMPVW